MRSRCIRAILGSRGLCSARLRLIFLLDQPLCVPKILSVLIAWPNRLNVSGDDRADLLRPDPVRFAVRIAIFHPAIPTTLLTETGGGSAWRAFFGELRRLGYVEGENLVIERYSAEGHHERYADIAREIVARNPDVIVTGTNPVVIAFKAATSTIPLVAFMLDPLHARLVASLSRPGGNLTGITLDAGIEVWGKRLEVLKEAVPSATRAVFLGMRGGWEGSSGQVLREAAAQLGVSLVFTLPEKGTPEEIERVFAAMEQQRPDAVLVSGEGDLYANRQLIAELSVRNRLPTICPYRDHVEAGALLGYAVDLA